MSTEGRVCQVTGSSQYTFTYAEDDDSMSHRRERPRRAQVSHIMYGATSCLDEPIYGDLLSRFLGCGAAGAATYVMRDIALFDYGK
jgi:hypothetical protein